MFITPAFAQTVTGGAAGGGIASLIQFAPLVAMFAIIYFIAFRPAQVEQKKLKARLAVIKRGDKVVTAGGIVGTVKKVTDAATELDVEIAPNVVVSVVRATITSVLTPEPANDKV